MDICTQLASRQISLVENCLLLSYSQCFGLAAVHVEGRVCWKLEIAFYCSDSKTHNYSFRLFPSDFLKSKSLVVFLESVQMHAHNPKTVLQKWFGTLLKGSKGSIIQAC